MSSTDTFGSRSQQIATEFTEATDALRNDFYNYAVQDMDASWEFLQLYNDFATAGQRFQASISHAHRSQRYEILDERAEVISAHQERAAELNETGLDIVRASLGDEERQGSLDEFESAAMESDLASIAEETSLTQYEYELRENIAELGLPPDDTVEISDAVSNALANLDEAGIEGAIEVLRNQLTAIRERWTGVDQFGIQKNCDPLTTYFIVGTAVFGGVGLYYCVYKNDPERCEGAKKAAEAALSFGGIFKGFQLA